MPAMKAEKKAVGRPQTLPNGPEMPPVEWSKVDPFACRRTIARILKQGVHDYIAAKRRAIQSARGCRFQTKLDPEVNSAIAWVNDEDSRERLSFNHCCELLGLNAKGMRMALALRFRTVQANIRQFDKGGD